MANATIPTDPFKLTLYVYDKLTDFISNSQMISKSFLDPERALADIYNPAAFAQLADELSQEFETKLTTGEVKKSATIEGLCFVIVKKLAPQ